jgi:hypothetical protein
MEGSELGSTKNIFNPVRFGRIERLELSNWKIEVGPPLGGHGPGLMPKE